MLRGVSFPAAAFAAALILAPANAQPVPANAPQPSELIASAVDDVVARYGLPGIAVGVMVDGEVQQWELRGETVAGSGRPVARDTLFKVASNTKAMTAALLARQVDAGLLAWDDPVVRHLPQFRMYEDWVTREMQVRDLLIHNSGMGPGAGDLMLWPEPNDFTRADVIAGLAHLKPRWSFRSRYAYDNTLYIVAGEVAAAVGGAPFDVLLRREVFQPLGMGDCRIGEWRVEQSASVAVPHVRRDGQWVARPDGDVVADMPMAAAGGVRCSLDGMLSWTRAWLEPDNQRTMGWLSAPQRDAAWTAHVPMPLSSRMRKWNNSHFYAYGYGWRLTDVDGTAKVSHTGTLSGMYSAVTLLPELRTGFVILINGDAGEARTVLEQVLSKHFTAPQEGRSVAYYAEELAAERAALRSTAADDTTANPSVDPRALDTRSPASPARLASWLGRYRDPWFGEVSICPSAAGLRFESVKSPRLMGRVLDAGGRWLVDFDTLESDADAWLDFSEGEGEGTPELKMAKVDPDADFSYDFEDLGFQRIGSCPVMAAASAETGAVGATHPDTMQQVDELMKRYQGNGPGAALLVVRNGVPLVRRAYGMADLEKGVAATPSTNYRLASVSKQFTAAAILLLAEDERLTLDDSVRKWLPELPAGNAGITVRHLLTHASGLIDYEDELPDALGNQVRDADVLDILAKQVHTYFPPGGDFQYSNTGYALLALMVERISGEAYPEFLQQRIFQPLGMTRTLAYVAGGTAIDHRAFGYSRLDDQWARTDQSTTSAVLGDGGIYSSIDDLAKWDAALDDDRLLSDRSRKLAFAPTISTHDPAVDYGLGWYVGADRVWHSGETIGFRNVIVRFPQRLTVLILSNRNDPEPMETALAIAELFNR